MNAKQQLILTLIGVVVFALGVSPGRVGIGSRGYGGGLGVPTPGTLSSVNG